MRIDMQIFDSRLGSEWPYPSRVTALSAGIDLSWCPRSSDGYSIWESKIIEPGEDVMLTTGFGINIGRSHSAGFIYSLPLVSYLKNLVLADGVNVVEPFYKDEISVYLYNRGKYCQLINPGDRIAKLVIQPIKRPKFKIVDFLHDV